MCWRRGGDGSTPPRGYICHWWSASAELNPDEYVNNDLKGQGNASGLPHDKAQVRSHPQTFMRRLQYLPEHVINSFQHPSVQYAAAMN